MQSGRPVNSEATMSEPATEIHYDTWCCDNKEDPHVHVGEEGGMTFWRLGYTEFQAESMEAVLEAAERWLHRFAGD